MNEETQNSSKDSKLLTRMRERYRRAKDAWADIHKEGQEDMRYVANDPWSDEDKRSRKDAGRPCISFDEINQYLNQAINNLRQNKRAIKVNPKGNGADDKTAEFIEDHIRAIEYDSQAQRNAYIPAFESSISKSYGFFRITREYVSPKSFDQKIVIKGVLNADSVLYDPDCKEADWSDAEYCFIVEPMKKDEFKRQFPKAEVKDFGEADKEIARDFITDDNVVVAEYWEVEKTEKTLVLLEDGENGPVAMYKDELPENLNDTKFSKERSVEIRSLCKYITNGVEVLEKTEQPGSIIPIIPVIGKEIFVDEGSGPKRKLISMVRLARDPQMAMAFLASQQLEEFSMTPKAPFVGASGQFEGHEDEWGTVNKVPRAYLEYNVITDSAQGVLPPPSRPQYTPNTQAYEMAKESVRRSVQAAMGIMPLPTAAQRQNDKSGIALQRIAAQEQIGSFHFTDNLDRALELAGRIILEWRKVVYDTEREEGVRGADDSYRVVKMNTAQPYQHPETGETEHYPVEQGDHSVTISIGPSYQSQREEVEDFADTLIHAAPNLLSVIGDLLVKMRNLGPMGDEIADRLTPPQFAKQGSPQQFQAQAQQSQQQLQAMHAYAQKVEGELNTLKQEKQAKVLDNDLRLQTEKMRLDAQQVLEKAKLEVQLAIAEIQTKAQVETERLKWQHAAAQSLGENAHEFAMQATQQAHDSNMADQNAAIQSEQSAQQAAQEAQQPADGQQPSA